MDRQVLERPPIVSEGDPAIVVERAQLRRVDGTLNAYAAYPKHITGNTPGIVLCMSEWGVDDQLRDTVRRFAKAGYMCIAPDLYARMRTPDAKQLQRKQYNGDLRAAALHLLAKAPNCKLGVVGFGLGGHLALVQAIDNSDIFDAVAPLYGEIKNIDPTELHVPICASYGEKDTTIPAEEVRAWRATLRVTNDVRVYASSGHGFFDNTRADYVASAADDAWKRMLGFFKDKLGLT